MKTMLISMTGITFLLLVSVALADQEPFPLRKRADVVRATAGEMSFRKIPWVTDLFKGFELAKQENRPVFLYVITGDPLDDC